MKILETLIVVIAVAATSLTRGQEIAVNFNVPNGGTPLEDITAATGVVSVAAADWNNVNQGSPAVSGYIDSTGASLPDFSLTVSYGDPYNTSGHLTNLGNLFDAYADHFASLTVSSIPYAEYDVYVYVGADVDGRDFTGTIGTESLNFSTASGTSSDLSSFTINSTPDPLTHPSVNTLEFTDVTGSSFTYSQNSVGDSSSGVFGFEIVEVPEPSTWAMMLGGLAFFGFCVRRKAALLG